MNSRQRFLATLHHDRPDRFPFMDHGIREDVLEVWRRQGLPADTDVRELFGLERWEVVGQHADVEIELRALPEYGGRLRGRLDWDRLRSCYDPESPPRYPSNWQDLVAGWRERAHPLGLIVWRGFLLPLQVGGWESLADLLLLVHDDPALVEEMVAAVTDFSLLVLERALADVEWDFAIFEEPIASNHASVLSPEHYRRFCLPHIRRVAARVRSAGIDLLVADSQGAVEPLIPIWMEAGLNTLWLGDVAAAGLDYVDLRRRYGAGLGLIGGLDLRVLTMDQAAVGHEVMGTVPPLLAEGGYIPLLDGRVRKGMPCQNYAYYRQLLAELAGDPGFNSER